MGEAKAKKERVEMQQPPGRWIWISYGLLLSYALVAIEGGRVIWLHPWQSALALERPRKLEPDAFLRIWSGQLHLCGIYGFEILLAVSRGWCAMSPGWTVSELIAHHLPYCMAVAFAFLCGHAERWSSPMAMVLLTPLNEGLFIATGLGAPAGLQKIRRLFGFFAILSLFTCELWNMVTKTYQHYQIGQEALTLFLSDQIVWFGIYYHADLLRMYIKRWGRKRSL